MLCKLEGQDFRAFRVVRHDLADAAYINRNDRGDTPYELDDARIKAKDVYDSLVSMGLSEEHVKPFRGVQDEDEFIEALGEVDQHLQTYALGLYETTGVVVPRSKYTVFDTNVGFEKALRGSLEQWELYLHPSQKYIIELPVGYRLSVSGPAGTGKTVCAWYRSQHLAHAGNSIGFVCPNKKILDVSKRMLASVLQSAKQDCYFLVPNSSDDIVQLAEAVDHVVVDEGQEFATGWFSDLGAALTNMGTGLTLFYDLNQLGGNIPAGDTKHFKYRLDTWLSRLDSIPQLAKMELHINYRNSKEIADYFHDALAGFLPQNYRASVHSFGAGEVVIETVNDQRELGFRIARVVHALRKDFGDGEIGLIFNGRVREGQGRVLRELRTLGIETTRDIQNKNMVLSASPRDIKGHERKAIVFCTPPMDYSTRKWGQAINVYVALTRARDRLVVVQCS